MLEKYEKMNFNREQLVEIEEGLKEGLDVEIYTKPEFTFWEMFQIRSGLKKGIEVCRY